MFVTRVRVFLFLRGPDRLVDALHFVLITSLFRQVRLWSAVVCVMGRLPVAFTSLRLTVLSLCLRRLAISMWRFGFVVKRLTVFSRCLRRLAISMWPHAATHTRRVRQRLSKKWRTRGGMRGVSNVRQASTSNFDAVPCVRNQSVGGSTSQHQGLGFRVYGLGSRVRHQSVVGGSTSQHQGGFILEVGRLR